jgi:hypothetical protein
VIHHFGTVKKARTRELPANHRLSYSVRDAVGDLGRNDPLGVYSSVPRKMIEATVK